MTKVYLDSELIAEVWQKDGLWYFCCEGFSNGDTVHQTKEEAMKMLLGGLSKWKDHLIIKEE
jgi:hypothetical protein